MQVVNVKVNNIRPRYNNLKEWIADPNNVYIGRRGVVFIDGERFPKQDSKWANPFKIGKDGSREDVIEKYKQYIKGKDVSELVGKKLGCWCYPEACHGDVLVNMVAMSELKRAYVKMTRAEGPGECFTTSAECFTEECFTECFDCPSGCPSQCLPECLITSGECQSQCLPECLIGECFTTPEECFTTSAE